MSTELKVVLCGDAFAGKTSLQNALAGRANPRQHEDDRTLPLDLESLRIVLDDAKGSRHIDDEPGFNELTMNICYLGGQEQ